MAARRERVESWPPVPLNRLMAAQVAKLGPMAPKAASGALAGAKTGHVANEPWKRAEFVYIFLG